MNLKDCDFGELQRRFEAALKAVQNEGDLELVRRDWLGKEGTVKELFRQLKDVEAAEKPRIAALLNELRAKVEGAIEHHKNSLTSQAEQEEMKRMFIDLSLPGSFVGLGGAHPITRVNARIAEILKPFGFVNAYGPEIETEYYCFDALNTPKHHPARDMQDTFYTATGHMLRTHTTAMQARRLEQGGLPVRLASFGKVYRNETESVSNQAMFHQFDLVWLDKGLTVSNLTGLINHIIKELFGKRTKVRFVPKYYPYTEPSIGVQIDCAFCKTAGCQSCKYQGWATVAGSGMIHRKVLQLFGYNPEEVSGFAFGLGPTRMASQRFGLPDGRLLYQSDLRILKELV